MLSEDFNALKTYPYQIPWCTISEFWNNEWWYTNEPHGFRVTLEVGKPEGDTTQLHFILEGENAGQKLVWRANPQSTKVAVRKGWIANNYDDALAKAWAFILSSVDEKGMVHNAYTGWAVPAEQGLVNKMDERFMGFIPVVVMVAADEMTR